MSNIIALIPAFNEEKRIQPVIQASLQYLPVWVVDDGSQDGTAALAESCGAHVIRQVPNQGKGRALQTGFSAALETGMDAVVTLDADGQHLPAEIPLFLNSYQATSADLIIGQRDFSKMPFIRRFSNTTGRALFSWAVRMPISDNQSGYRLISARLMQAMLESQESGFELEVEMLLICIINKFRLEWVPISTIYAGESSHIKPLKHAYNFFRVTFATRRRTRNL